MRSLRSILESVHRQNYIHHMINFLKKMLHEIWPHTDLHSLKNTSPSQCQETSLDLQQTSRVDTSTADTSHSRLKGFIFLASIMTLALIAAIAIAATLGVHAHHPFRANDPELVIPPLISPVRTAISANFPDPSLWYQNGTWYAYATNNAAGIKHIQNSNASLNTPAFGQANVQMATSTDFINWTVAPLAHQPLPVLGAWSRGNGPRIGTQGLSGTWAPGVGLRPDGKYVMYYSAPSAGVNPRPDHPHPHCVGAAVSIGDSPAGPYEAVNEVLACPVDRGGAIDPEVYSEDNILWVVYKIDGNNVGNGGECKSLEGRAKQLACMLMIIFQAATPSSPSSQPLSCYRR